MNPVANPSDEALIELLKNARTIAVVGLSTNPQKDSHAVARYLKEQGYTVLGINPNPALKEVFSPAYTSLQEVPPELTIDIVDFFLPPERIPPVAQAAIERGVKALWLQAGIRSPEVAKMAQKAGVLYVEDLCIRVFHQFQVRNRKPHAG